LSAISPTYLTRQKENSIFLVVHNYRCTGATASRKQWQQRTNVSTRLPLVCAVSCLLLGHVGSFYFAEDMFLLHPGGVMAVEMEQAI
jgi:hypothetical protein